MRIVHLLSCEGPWGDATAALYLAREQQSQGHIVTVLIKNGPLVRAFIDRARGAGVQAHVLDGVELNPSVSARTYTWRLFRQLLRHRPRVVHLHERGLTSKLSDVLPARLCMSRRVVTTVHYFGEFVDPENRETAEKKRWRTTSRLLSLIVTPSEKAAAVQRTAGVRDSKIMVMYNIVDVSRIRTARRSPVRSELGLNEDDLLFLFLARLDVVKHPLLSIEAFSRLLPDRPTARLAIAGSGPLADACSERITTLGVTNSVHMLGFRHDVGELFQAADVFLSPSEAEAFGNTIVEAMVSRTPVIASDIEPIVGEVLPPSGGCFHAVGDVDGAARAMRVLADDADLRAQIASEALVYAERMHDPAAICHRHITAYRGRRNLSKVASRLLRRAGRCDD